VASTSLSTIFWTCATGSKGVSHDFLRTRISKFSIGERALSETLRHHANLGGMVKRFRAIVIMNGHHDEPWNGVKRTRRCSTSPGSNYFLLCTSRETPTPQEETGVNLRCPLLSVTYLSCHSCRQLIARSMTLLWCA